MSCIDPEALFVDKSAALQAFIPIYSQINPLVPDAHYSERQDKPFSLQI